MLVVVVAEERLAERAGVGEAAEPVGEHRGVFEGGCVNLNGTHCDGLNGTHPAVRTAVGVLHVCKPCGALSWRLPTQVDTRADGATFVPRTLTTPAVVPSRGRSAPARPRRDRAALLRIVSGHVLLDRASVATRRAVDERRGWRARSAGEVLGAVPQRPGRRNTGVVHDRHGRAPYGPALTVPTRCPITGKTSPRPSPLATGHATVALAAADRHHRRLDVAAHRGGVPRRRPRTRLIAGLRRGESS